MIKKPNYYKGHFNLTEGKRALLETALDGNISVDFLKILWALSQATEYHDEITY